jgi:CelD/BcsL family acetyltransferase involved in cellulose biosynthesis
LRSGPTEFSTLRDAQAITAAFDALRRYRSARFKAIGAPDVLDNEAVFRFYRGMAIEGAEDGSARTERLSLPESRSPCSSGWRSKAVYSMLMIGLDIARHARLSPGLLAIEDSIRSAIETGDRVYDFTIGDHPYKLQFGGAR